MRNIVNDIVLAYPELISSAYSPLRADRIDDAFTAVHRNALQAYDAAPEAYKTELRTRKLRRLVATAAGVPLWRGHLGAVTSNDIETPADITKLPVTTKDTYRLVPVPERTDVRIARCHGVKTMTSGSTGEPLEFYIDGRLKVRQRALLAHTAGLRHFSIASLVNIWPTHNPNPLFGRVFFSARTKELLFERRHELYGHLRRPGVILQGFSSYFRLLLEFVEADGVELRPAMIVTSGEALPLEVARMLEDRFRCPVTNYLGSREFSIMAGRCTEGRYHLESQDLMLEVLDEHGRACADGEAGLLTFTGLNSHIAPFIRYQNGDYGTLHAGACPCGNRAPSFSFIGRADDAVPIELSDGTHIMPYRFTGIFNTRSEKVRQYQIVHHAPGAFRLLVVPTTAFGPSDREDILSAFKTRARTEAVKLELVDTIPSSGPKVLPYRKTY